MKIIDANKIILEICVVDPQELFMVGIWGKLQDHDIEQISKDLLECGENLNREDKQTYPEFLKEIPKDKDCIFVEASYIAPEYENYCIGDHEGTPIISRVAISNGYWEFNRIDDPVEFNYILNK